MTLSFDGTSVPGLTVPITAIARAIAQQGDGKVLMGGQFTSVNGVNRGGIARLNADGSLDSGFQNGLSGIGEPLSGVQAISVQSDGKILIAGGFKTVNGVKRHALARLNADGTLDTSFQTALSPDDGSVGFVMVQGDGKVLIGGGYFTSVNGVSRSGLARLNADGSTDLEFGDGLTGPNGLVSFLALDGNGKVVLAGGFTMINDVRVPPVARLWANSEIPPWLQIKSIDRGETGVTIRWYARANQTYRVQFKDSISANTWTDLAGDVSGTSTGIASKTDLTSGSARQRFYRVILLP